MSLASRDERTPTQAPSQAYAPPLTHAAQQRGEHWKIFPSPPPGTYHPGKVTLAKFSLHSRQESAQWVPQPAPPPPPPPPHALRTAEGGTPGEKISGSPGHLPSGGRTPSKILPVIPMREYPTGPPDRPGFSPHARCAAEGGTPGKILAAPLPLRGGGTTSWGGDSTSLLRG